MREKEAFYDAEVGALSVPLLPDLCGAKDSGGDEAVGLEVVTIQFEVVAMYDSRRPCLRISVWSTVQ